MKHESILISVIVPIYNVKAYLGKCIESICNQTHKNVEIILVDDGSTDGGSDLCDQYAQRDQRIKVIHKENGGIASARKEGARAAHGRYIGFVDGDDWIEPDMYEELLNAAVDSGAEIVLSDMYREKFTGETTIWSGADFPEGVYDMKEKGEMIARHLLSGVSSKHNGINGGVHIKLFERNILIRYLEPIDDKLCRFGEDKAIVYPAILNSKKIYIMHKAFYHGVDRKDSATHSTNERIFEHLQILYDYLKKVFETHVYRELLMQQLYHLLMLSSVSNINMMASKQILNEYAISEIGQIKNKQIVLYGAGKVGRAYYQQITQNDICEIVLWVDKVPNEKKEIYNPQKVLKVQYDYVVVALAEEMMFKEISRDLISQGVEAEKIIWIKPIKQIEYID